MLRELGDQSDSPSVHEATEEKRAGILGRSAVDRPSEAEPRCKVDIEQQAHESQPGGLRGAQGPLAVVSRYHVWKGTEVSPL